MTNKRAKKRLFVLLTCLASLLVLSPVVAQETTPVELHISPAAAQVGVAQTVDLGIEVVEVEGLYGFDVRLSFDPLIAEVVDADPNTAGVQVALGTFLDPGFVVRNAVDNSAGTVEFAMTQLNPSEPKSGTGMLLVLKLAGKQAGTSTAINLDTALLANRDAIEIPTTLISGQLDVAVATSEQATSTPIPTQGAGTPLPTLGPEPTARPATATPEAGTVRLTATTQPQMTVLSTSIPVPATSKAGVSVPTSLPMTGIPPQAAASATGTSVSSLSTPLPSTIVHPATPSPVGQPAETAVVQVPLDRDPGAPVVVRTEEPPDPARTFLWISVGALGLAMLVGLIAIVLLLALRSSPSK